MDAGLAGRALQLAEEGFEERVQALVEGAHGDRSELALAAATLSATGPTQGDSKEQIAFALLLEAAHRTAPSPADLSVVGSSG